MKSTTQINALLTGRIILQQLLNIQNTTSETFLVHQPIKQKKKKLVTVDEISINIPEFCDKVSACKLKIFTTAGPRLVELLNALNDNWMDNINQATFGSKTSIPSTPKRIAKALDTVFENLNETNSKLNCINEVFEQHQETVSIQATKLQDMYNNLNTTVQDIFSTL
ncbi:11374_t:CDS:2, partial [Ambispora leptoticha]